MMYLHKIEIHGNRQDNLVCEDGFKSLIFYK